MLLAHVIIPISQAVIFMSRSWDNDLSLYTRLSRD